MKVIYLGTPEFSATILEALISSDYEIAAVITNPDAPVGRKQILTPSPVKVLAEKNKIPVVQLDEIRNFDIDLAIVAAYGKIIPKNILDIPHHGTINVHPSLLPKYRGASPIQNAIFNGDKKTGMTIMKLDEEMDHGPILAQEESPIADNDTYESLSQKLALLGAELLIKTIPGYVSGKIKLIEQNHAEATYTKIIKKEDGKINWSKSAEEIERMVRAFYPWPAAWTIWEGKTLKILEAEVRNGKLEIKKLQLEGGKILSIKEFKNGHKNFNVACLK
ncbi:MAG: methionyl-tRNA formyltransferase [Candidatus Azambacteria bacterium]|nr:methionyl-tRNA formyltransferase [Candidatus Azambacteria bacterium]